MNIYEYLQSFGIKPSVQRIAIMDYLYHHRTHPSIDEIYTAIAQQIPTLSKTTVYNTLRLFVEHGAAVMLTIDERNACFDADISRHAHFICKSCGKILDIPVKNDIDCKTAENMGLMIEETHVYYRGLCSECKVKTN